MLNARKNLLNLWRSRRGLIMLLLAGGLICLLAAVAPQAWATPDPNGTVPPVGGTTLPYAWLSALAPLLALVVLVAAAVGVAVVWKRRQG